MDDSKDIKQISITTRVIATEKNKTKIKKLIQELENIEAIPEGDAEVIITAANCL